MNSILDSADIRKIDTAKKHYQGAFEYLSKYQNDSLVRHVGTKSVYTITFEECRQIIEKLESKKLSGAQLEDLKKYISVIYQSFLGEEVYKSTQAKAANLLYMLINDKGILKDDIETAVSLFLYFLDKNDILYDNNEKNISDKTLVLLTLLLKGTKDCEREKTVSLITNFLTKNYQHSLPYMPILE